jgi:hypothetical protein
MLLDNVNMLIISETLERNTLLLAVAKFDFGGFILLL